MSTDTRTGICRPPVVLVEDLCPSDLPASVPSEPRARPRHGLPLEELRTDEQVLHHWGTHAGRGVLTNQRLFLLGHPAPLHRAILWTVELERLTDLVVVEPQFPQAYRVQTQVIGGSYGVVAAKGNAEPVEYDALFLVRVNEATIFTGGPDKAAQVQRWIDEARVARMIAVLGHIAAPTGAYSGTLPSP